MASVAEVPVLHRAPDPQIHTFTWGLIAVDGSMTMRTDFARPSRESVPVDQPVVALVATARRQYPVRPFPGPRITREFGVVAGEPSEQLLPPKVELLKLPNRSKPTPSKPFGKPGREAELGPASALYPSAPPSEPGEVDVSVPFCKKNVIPSAPVPPHCDNSNETSSPWLIGCGRAKISADAWLVVAGVSRNA